MKKKYYNKIQNVQTLNEYKFSIKKIIWDTFQNYLI
jgi:hypothetical protein